MVLIEIEPATEGDSMEVTHAFGDITLTTKRVTAVSLDQLELNKNQPRKQEHWSSPNLRRQILQARGLFTPPLCEPLPGRTTPDGRDMYLVDDGHRRATELMHIVAELEQRRTDGSLTQEEYDEGMARFSRVDIDVTTRPLNIDERVRVWILIHRERREWALEEREATAHQLIKLVGLESAAEFLGMSESAAQKLSDIFDISANIKIPPDQLKATGKDPRFTWAREIRNLKPSVRQDTELMTCVYARITDGIDKNSKDVRVLRDFDEDARQEVIDTPQTPLATIAKNHGVADPVRARRSVTVKAGASMSTALNDMAKVVGAFTFQQLKSASSAERKAAKAAITKMQDTLGDLSDLLK